MNSGACPSLRRVETRGRLTGRPTSKGCTDAGKKSLMLFSDILTGIVIGIERVATLAAKEEALRTTIIPSLIPTTRARLRRVARINTLHTHTFCLSLILDKGVQLSKRPGVQPTLPHTFALSRTFSNIGQVLKDNRTAGCAVFYDAFGEDMIVVFALPKQFATQLFEMSLCRFGAFGLQLTTKTEDAALLLFPSPFSQELLVGGDSGVVQAKINPNHLRGQCNDGIREGDDDVQEIAPMMEAQIRTTDVAANILHGMFGDRERDHHTSIDSSKAGSHRFPFDPRGTSVIAKRGMFRMWTANWLEWGWLFSLFFRLGYQLRIADFVFPLPGER